MYAIKDRKVPVIDFNVEDKLGVPQYMLDYSKDQSRKNYKQRMEDEGLFHKDQDYKNIQLTIGDETRYVPFALAHTDGESQIVILPPERMPYNQPWEFVLRHEKEHCVQIVSEYMTDLRAASPLREGTRDSAVRVKY